ncbi:MAG: MBOAT family protein [Chthoniobacterales bacterium]|nr:MBOAT family protein [Chthoniobacterales bacterium]
MRISIETVIFTTLAFALFLAVLLPLYWLLRSDRWRLPLLFAANFFFYGWWDWRFVALLLFVIVVAFAGGLLLTGQAVSSTKAKVILWIACGMQLAVLGYFKYADFFIANVRGVAESMGWQPGWTALNLILPVGISFYIFQAISYLVSVYRQTVPCERSFLKLGVYLGFFPHLVAGPIIHAKTFLPQLAGKRVFDRDVFFEGCRKFAIGFFYKSVFADNIAPFVDRVFSDVAGQSPLAVAGGCLGFYGQIYFDFAGYSLMAIGVANLFGYFLPENFNHPYRATSLIDFWRRWHISLSTWLRDYVYIPLGGNRGPRWMLYRNLMVTMFLGGLWHGADWNFVLWGTAHGTALCVNHVWVAGQKSAGLAGSRIFPVFSFAITQLFILLFWVPFRAETGADTLIVWGKLGELATTVWHASQPVPWLLLLLPLLADTWLVGSRNFTVRFRVTSPFSLYAVLAASAIVGLLFMHVGFSPFIYFQF